MGYKSPFFIVKDLMSPLQCEDTVRRLQHSFPNLDQAGNPTITYKGNLLSQLRITDMFMPLMDNVEKYYGFKFKTLTPFTFEWYPTGFVGQKATSEGSIFVNRKGESKTWQRIKDYDFTVVMFLNDINDGLDFDANFEVRGGKLEFPTHDFGFNPIRGTTIIYPCCPNFINAVAPITAGSLNIIRFQIIATETFQYDMNAYPGGYLEWFNE